MSDARPLTLLGGRLPTWAQLHVISIEPGARRPYVAAEWDGALVVLERGEIVLECERGDRVRFQEGAVLCLVDVPLCALCNDRTEPAVLSAVSRRAREDGASGGGRALFGPPPSQQT